MFNLFKIRTPHGNAGSHAVRMTAAFIASGLIALLCLQSIQFSAWLIGFAVFVPVVGFVVGLLLTIVLRRMFTLIQTGRVLQYACFWVGCLIAALVGNALFVGVLETSAAVYSLLTVVLAFGAMTAVGEVPWKGRTWFPLRRSAR